MKAVVYHGPRQVSVDEVPDARIEKPTDVLVRITSTNICGSDLHMYEGRTDFEQGRVFGHENVWDVVEVWGMLPGETVVIYGAGPLGLMAALSAITRGAAKVMVVDRHPDRLRLAEQIGAIAIDDSKVSPVDVVMEQTNGLGADRGCEWGGYQAPDPQGHGDNAATPNERVEA